MKKKNYRNYILVFLCILLLLPCLTGCEQEGASYSNQKYRFALITDAGEINDQSYNQIAFETLKKFADDEGIECTYFKPTGINEDNRSAMLDLAVAKGFNVIVIPGYLFAKTVAKSAPRYPDVKFICIDVTVGDLLTYLVPDYDYNPENYCIDDYINMDNIALLTFSEDIPGFMAGYMAVKLGYERLGFLGGMAVPAVKRYGYGYLQGADLAAKELGKTVKMNYAYANQFYADNDITAAMETWYANDCQIVFSAGGAIFDSVAFAAAEYDGKIIGVDVDQRSLIDSTYGDGLTVTSAMKGVGESLEIVLKSIVKDNLWEKYAGKENVFGLADEDNPEIRYCGLPVDTSLFDENFSREDYEIFFQKLNSGEIVIDNDITQMPECSNVEIHNYDSIK